MIPEKGTVPPKGEQLSLCERIKGWDKVGEYEAAERLEMSLLTKLAVAADLLLATLQCTLLSVFLLAKALFGLLIPSTPKDISGQLALVSGGGNGLGRELSRELARCGARVAVVDLDARAAEETARELCRRSGRADTARAYTADVSSPQAVRDLHLQISADWGAPVEILVNNAGLLCPISVLNGSESDIDRIIDVNLKSHFWMLRAFLPAMLSASRGHVVSICSMAGLSALSRACAYTATKFGVRGLSLALLAELRDAGAGAENVRVTIAYPYFLTTRKELIDNVELRIPPIDPAEAARRIVAGVRREQLHVGVPAHMPYLANLLSAMPDDVVELFRKTFKTEIKQ